MELTEIKPNIYHAEFDERHQLLLTMIRMQEYYESPYKDIKGKVFPLDELIASFMKDTGRFDYFSEVIACNVPGEIAMQFYEDYGMKLTSRERKLRDKLPKRKSFYLIATCGKDSLDHEVAHGFYHLDKNFRKEMDALTDKLPDKGSLIIELVKLGYSMDVMDDEIQAFLATTQLSELPELFDGFAIDYKFVSKYRRIFDKYYA